MTLSDTARAHLAQCRREDVSEELLRKLADENDALRAELEHAVPDAEAARARLELTKQVASWTPWNQ